MFSAKKPLKITLKFLLKNIFYSFAISCMCIMHFDRIHHPPPLLSSVHSPFLMYHSSPSSSKFVSCVCMTLLQLPLQILSPPPMLLPLKELLKTPKGHTALRLCNHESWCTSRNLSLLSCMDDEPLTLFPFTEQKEPKGYIGFWVKFLVLHKELAAQTQR